MAKRRIEKVQPIANTSHRKVSPFVDTNQSQVTYCKRKKGLLKKSMELSILCELKMFLFIYDERQQRVVHYASDPNVDITELFNKKAQREYYTNADYVALAGREDEDEFEEESPESKMADNLEATHKTRHAKIFSSKRKEGQVTSRIGSLNQ